MKDFNPENVIIKFSAFRDMVGVFDGRELILNLTNPTIAKIRRDKNRAAAVAVASHVVMTWSSINREESFEMLGIWNDCTQLYVSALSTLANATISWDNVRIVR